MANASVVPVATLDEILAKTVYREASMEVVFVDKVKVCCDGGGALGHPRVYYTIGPMGYAECGYCDRLFVYDPSRAGTVLEGGVVEGQAKALA